ncbi:hypothetical protein EV1_028244 [Malus domestica]
MPKSLTSTQEDAINPTFLAFKPGQVLLVNRDMEHRKPNNSADSAQTLSPDQKGPLLRAVARFLENNGFSKTLSFLPQSFRVVSNSAPKQWVRQDEAKLAAQETALVAPKLPVPVDPSFLAAS